MGATYNHFQETGFQGKINFVFDEQILDLGMVDPSWREFVKLAPPKIKALIGDSPTFSNDVDTVALQAADLNVGWMRMLAEAEMRKEPRLEMPWGDRGDNLKRMTHLWDEERGLRLYEYYFGLRPVRVICRMVPAWTGVALPLAAGLTGRNDPSEEPLKLDA